MVKGRVKRSRIGLMIAFTIPSRIETTSAAGKSLTVTPSSK